jgi:branched-chain amino acid transport system substrate-binding protein
MKPCHFITIIILGILLFFWSCAPKPGVTPTPVPIEIGNELFLDAEKQFQEKFYEEALSSYQDYLLRFPKEPMAPAALMKIGIIDSILGNYDDAQQAYQRLIAEYPGSSFSQDAMFEILSTYYQQAKFQEIISRAPAVLEKMNSADLIIRTYVLVGDAYLAIGSPLDAIQYYSEARKRSSDLELEAVNLKLKEAIARMNSDEVAHLLSSTDESLPLGYLWFQLGLNYALEEKYEDALHVLEEFIERYPEHENAATAKSLIEEIKKNALFKRYTLGCLLPLSGPYQAFGARALRGIELAQAQFSSNSGNPSINIIVKDTGAEPDKTRQALQELNAEGVAAIIGPIVTAGVAAQEAQDKGIPIITLTQKENITEIGDNVFRNFITPEMQVQTLVRYAVESLGLKRFAILYPDENYGNTFMNLFWDQLIENGGKVVGLQAYNPEHTDFADPIKKLVGLYYPVPEDLKAVREIAAREINLEKEDAVGSKSDKDYSSDQQEQQEEQAGSRREEESKPIVDFEAIFIPDAPKKTGLIIPQLVYYDVKNVLLLGTNLWHSDALIKMAQNYVQGAVMADGFFAESNSPIVRGFVEKFEETYQEEPGYIEAVAYDTAALLFEVVSKPQIRFRNEIKEELFNLTEFQGVTGATRFDENGEAQKRLYLLTIKGRKFVELKEY